MKPDGAPSGTGPSIDSDHAETVAPPLPEVYGPPAFEPGCKVRSLKPIRNDGTVPGSAMGTVILEAGAVGYVTGIGEFLQRFYIYRVDFVDAGRIIGMRRDEIESLDGEAAGAVPGEQRRAE
ncbi:MAG: nitrogen fixation protein NifZ [Rhodospirillales bacterium]|nr:MAG: nitrogen fixation protein NifZ [Rhodospirillales bacterium]